MPRAAATSRPNLAPIAFLAVIAGVAPSAVAQSFTLVGRAPGTAASRIYALSADGRNAAGYSQQETQANTLYPGFRWNANAGRHDFGVGLAPPYSLTLGFGMSGDGATVVGASKLVEGGAGTAFRWTQGGGYQNLGLLPNFTTSEALDASHDGSVIVGTLENPGGGSAAFRWTQSGGMQSLGGGTSAEAISGNGSVIVGNFSFTGSFTWTAANGVQPLTGLEGTLDTTAWAVNHGGSIVVGTSRLPNSVTRTTMWIDGSPIELTNLIASTRFTPQAVSDDGSVVAGILSGSGAGARRTAVWTAVTGTQRLEDYLTSNGVVLPAGIVLETCEAISADGRTFAGYSSDGPYGVQGWVATVPAPCPADLDNDGLLSNGGTRDRAVTIDDLLFLLAAFEAGNMAADLDNGSNTGTRDNAVTIDDLLYFLTHFEAGC